MKPFNTPKNKLVVGGGNGGSITLAVVVVCIVFAMYIMYFCSVRQYNIENSKSYSSGGRIFKIHNAHENQEKALSILTEVDKKIKLFIANFPDKKVTEKYHSIEFYENSPHSGSTSYVTDDMIALCIRDEYGEFHDMNTVTFVALHELSHIATDDDEEDHGNTYWTNFANILRKAESLGIIELIDYKNNPVRYCGVEITSNPGLHIPKLK